MDPNGRDTKQVGLWDRVGKSWFPPAAVVGAFAAFVAAAFRVRPAPKVTPRPAEPTGKPPQTARRFDREYTQSAVVGGAASAHPFHRSLAGIAVGAGDRIYALGDGEVRIFDPGGNLVRNWKVSEKGACLTVGSDGRVYIGGNDRVEIHDAAGSRIGGFAAGEKDRPANITAIKVFQKEILVADAAARLIRLYDSSGKHLGVIGNRNKTGNFILPNRSLDIDVDARGVIRATDTGRHQVTAWSLDGSPLGAFGKFGMSNPEDFVGCCNPVNLALAPDGKVVTGEKMIARVKVYEPDGRLLALIGPENFDPNCIHIHLAVDSKGRILAADPVRREIKIFSLVVRVGVHEPFCRETSSSCVGAEVARNYDPLARLVRGAMGVELRFSYFKLEDQLVAAVERGQVDGMIAKTWTVLRAYRATESGCERICDLPFPDGDPDLTGVFITRSDGPVRSIEDLAGRKLAIGRPESYENSHAVERILRKLGLEPIAKQEYGGCIPAAVSVLEGSADAAVVSSYCTRYGLDEIIGKPGAFRTLGETAPIPFVTFALSERLSGELRVRLKESLLQACGRDTAPESLPGGLRPPQAWKPEELERA